MSQEHESTRILGLQGWEIIDIYMEEDGLVLSIVPKLGTGYRCSQCGTAVLFAYDHLETRRIRDFPWAGHPCELAVTLARVDCPNCHAVADKVVWCLSSLWPND